MARLGIGAAVLACAVALTVIFATLKGAERPDAPRPPPLDDIKDMPDAPRPTPLDDSKDPPAAPTANATAAEKKAVVAGNTAFALELYAQLAKTEKGNLFFSPYSISTALAMTYAGARGNTEKEMAAVLHFTLSQDCLHPAFQDLLTAPNAPPPAGKKRAYQLSVANRLWGQQDLDFRPEFLDLTKTRYGAELAQVDFKDNAARELARRTINAWVEKETQCKIKELVKPGALTRRTRLVLTNAIYFKGDWAAQFKKVNTCKTPFHLSGKEKAEVDMMNQIGPFRYAEPDAALQVLELPYAGEELSMVLLLPRAVGLTELEAKLNPMNLKLWLESLHARKVVVGLPRFKNTSEFQLNEALKAMGMVEAFIPNQEPPPPDFSGMTGKPLLHISAVIHKAFVEVNEEGTEAAAATAVVMDGRCSGPGLTAVFRADRPFIYLIRDLKSESILFLGRMLDPR